ncbi:alpha/beta hydrolase [Saccharothrix violaceirubra]|uniref:Pimeloyl-ACP methyl ester carboxylesterase n=1 Tax=Saccharothrix violaceirubra TaxID=413306 RepID=A0A7W7T3T1_9PSEU|nr:alpha/beta hydrolase [Saccharothrix violaceirubra]MBB4966023.1 pimeloyl-ACP methyl ester carboxylesterase [Saccharothrix violaceirubra]
MTTTAAILDVPGAHLYHEVRGSGPLVVLVGAPMDANPFTPLAELLAVDHTVVTTDPRGINRSTVDDPDADATLDLRASDLAALIRHVDAGPAVVLGSSGGAVSTLALAQAYPDLVRVAIAHEPPLTEVLDDREELHRRTDDIIATHQGGDVLGAWRKFFVLANIDLPEPVFLQMFGGERTPQEIADDDFQHNHMMRPTTRWQPDVAVLRSIATRIVIGIGAESGGQFCERTSIALGRLLDVEPTIFPGGHIGFAEQPEAFEKVFRSVL